MLIVGLVSTREEQHELRFIAQMCIIGERIRFIARQQNSNENQDNITIKKKEEITIN